MIHFNPDSKDHGANMGPTCVLSAPGGPHVGPMNLATRKAYDITEKQEATKPFAYFMGKTLSWSL